MTFTIALRMACIVFMANAIAATAAAAELHNFVVLMPEAMQPGNVNDADTPALARLREEGVYFSRTYAGFPRFTFADEQKSAASRAAELAATSYKDYAGLVVDDSPPTEANVQQVLATLRQKNRPFILIYRLRGLDTQTLTPARPLRSPHPGGEGAAGTLLLNTDRALASVERTLKDLGLFDTTNIVVAAEHGRATIWKQSRSSYTGEMRFSGISSGTLPPGFLAIDVLKAMLLEDGSLALFDPGRRLAPVRWWSGEYPSTGSAIIGVMYSRPYVSIESRGGYDLLYMPQGLNKQEVARRGRYIVEHLFLQDYMEPGYLLANGVPYSADAILTEYFDRIRLPNGDDYLILTSILDDPIYLGTAYVTTSQFKREKDGGRWGPAPCDSK